MSECKKECDERAWCFSLDFGRNQKSCYLADKIYGEDKMGRIIGWTACFVGKFIFATIVCFPMKPPSEAFEFPVT